LLNRLPVIFWAVAAVMAGVDLWTKHLIFQHLPHFNSEPIVIVEGFLRIVHSENRGGVFGLAQGSAMWLIFGIIAGALVIWFAHRKENKAVVLQIALGLVMAGAIGNVFDRVVITYVRDFLDVCYWPGKHWPAFNVADAGICVGAVYLAIHALFFMPPTEKKAKS
jgi:signal peptidase II